MSIKKIKKRNGVLVNYNSEKILNAIKSAFTAVYGDGWCRNLDGTYLWSAFACWPVNALLRLSSPLIPLASFRHERDLVFACADGAG